MRVEREPGHVYGRPEEESVNRIQTFWCEPSDRAVESLRRYAGEAKCPGPIGYHNAEIVLAEVEYPHSEYNGHSKDDLPHDDARWPRLCSCGYAFVEADNWQHCFERLYRRVDTGALHPLDQLPAGGSYDSQWHALHGFGVGADGVSLTVVLPDGTHWNVDGPSTNSKTPWSRTGTPRACDVTANPSIASPRYHGFLRSGWLEEC
jgi:hypothetical protein